MQDTLFDSQLVEREFGSHVVHVPPFLEWVESKGLILPPSNPPIEDYNFAQVEAMLCAIERACSSMTPQQALDVVRTRPELFSHRLHDADTDDEYIERIGVRTLRKKAPERGDARFARWQLCAGVHATWRKLIAAGIQNKEIALFDFASKLPIDGMTAHTEPPANGKRWTNAEVDRLRNSHVTIGLKATAEAFGISTSRVHKILNPDIKKKKIMPTANKPFGSIKS